MSPIIGYTCGIEYLAVLGGRVQRFTPDTPIKDVLLSSPRAAAILEARGLHCASCLAAELETLDSVAAMHDVPVAEILAELNELEDGEGAS